MPDQPECELTILMPCLNEAETLATCIGKAQGYLDRAGIVGEVLVADNGSTDGSQAIAGELGARVVDVPEQGYGSALGAGIRSARGRYVVMGDADDSYDFSSLDPYVHKLRDGAELVMGNRFRGGIAPGAMPALHKYLGNPVLSGVGRIFFNRGVGDFHCGLRGMRRDAVLRLGLRTSGMEFASEMVVKASLAKLDIREVPTTLSKDGRSRPPHLRSWRDGWRHLRFLFVFSPRWLFLYPGLAATALGLLSTLVLLITPVSIGSLGFDLATMIYMSGLTIMGFQAVLFWVLTKVYAAHQGFLPTSSQFEALADRLSLERGLVGGLLLFFAGLLVALGQTLRWSDLGFGTLDPSQTVRVALPAMLGLALGFQTIMFSMFVGILTIPTTGGGPLLRRTVADASPARQTSPNSVA